MQLTPIGIIHTPYKEKFAIPRQPGLVKQAQGEIHLCTAFADANAFRGIDAFSHLWLLFQFHQTAQRGWSPLVRPPRLGGNAKLGVFATRSTHRPNAIGLSVVENLGIEQQKGQLLLKVRGMDLMDGTPILDIKPYLPYADAIPDASGGFANTAPAPDMQVHYAAEVIPSLLKAERQSPGITDLIKQVLAQDPRPAYKKKQHETQEFGMHLGRFNIRWQVRQQESLVIEIQTV
ncbi:tRNA (N6-threonylcarbamoyladenosine(37)-N6)-methyltransferase TrmO [Bowmanella pacifica]|uniref:tRNA (N6-threonylcarbamoyladenosine(37)-N6)-methyltransferase TrmO n=1 Tax=Bowmanella pacifica TaxID=502051 RepID=A0A917Z3V1_9ALTE|nr:tRNA (N6-threonylcarbamoyladenosine(37)-N6)-methyltransferase TrmO [Bowmanella pacifica]GGO72153.1 tRNA (N6-threonylcarbamoyladenosine(37)-N6)-methyltransferase TrmO [Bowmanella pacifica]